MGNVTKAIYEPGRTWLNSLVVIDENGIEREEFSKKPVSVYLYENPGMVCSDLDDAIKAIKKEQDSKYLTGWTEITESEYEDALNILPPQKWLTVDGVNIFRMSEYMTSNITGHYAQCLGKYYTAYKRTSEPYKIMAQEIKNLRSKEVK